VIFDGAESLLSPEKIEYINRLQEYMNWTAQLIVVSSTLSKEILEFSEDNMADPIKIIVNTREDLALLEGTYSS
jgi:superfamily II DNA/RNA helicase